MSNGNYSKMVLFGGESMNNKNIIALRFMFRYLRQCESENDTYWTGRAYEEINGYTSALYHLDIVDKEVCNKIKAIARSVMIYGSGIERK